MLHFSLSAIGKKITINTESDKVQAPESKFESYNSQNETIKWGKREIYLVPVDYKKIVYRFSNNKRLLEL